MPLEVRGRQRQREGRTLDEVNLSRDRPAERGRRFDVVVDRHGQRFLSGERKKQRGVRKKGKLKDRTFLIFFFFFFFRKAFPPSLTDRFSAACFVSLKIIMGAA